MVMALAIKVGMYLAISKCWTDLIQQLQPIEQEHAPVKPPTRSSTSSFKLKVLNAQNEMKDNADEPP